jgi:hypothetical protein
VAEFIMHMVGNKKDKTEELGRGFAAGQLSALKRTKFTVVLVGVSRGFEALRALNV